MPAKSKQRKHTSPRSGFGAAARRWLTEHTIRASGGPAIANEPATLRLTAGEEAGVTIEAAAGGDGEKKLPRFQGTAYTGGLLRLAAFYNPVVVDLQGVTVGKMPRPVLRDHDLKRVVGHATTIDVKAQAIQMSGDVSGTGEDAREVVDNAKNKFPWRLSIGATITKREFVAEGQTVTVNGKSFAGPVLVARKIRLNEISFTAVDADGRTSVRVAASSKESTMDPKFVEWLTASGFDAEALTDQQLAPLQASYDAEQAAAGDGREPSAPITATGTATQDPPATPPADAPSDVQASLTQYQDGVNRIDRIRELTAEHPEIRGNAFSENWSVDRTENAVLRADIQASRPQGPAIHSEDGSNQSAPCIEAALCLSAGLDEEWLGGHYDERTMNAAVSKPMRGTTLWSLMDGVIHASGGHFSGTRKSNDYIRAAKQAERKIQASGFTTISLTGILGNVANKAMLEADQAVETIYPYICAMRSHSDFKVHTRYRLDATGAFQKVGPDGELKHAGVSEASYSAQLETHGAIIALTRQDIINDDMGAFLQIPMLLGRMSAVKKEEEVFKLLLSNPSSFFAAGNGNLLTGAGSALSITSLSSAETLFINQVDSAGKPILVMPRILLVGAPLKTTADDLWNETQVNVTTTANAPKFASNPHKGKYRPYVSPYLNNTAIRDASGTAITGQSDTQWYLFGDPKVIAAIVIATLNGATEPIIESDETDFSTLGVQWKAYDDFGVGMEDSAAAAKAAGA